VFEIGIGVAVFTAIVTSLVVSILIARRLLEPRGDVVVLVNQTRSVPARAGSKLLAALAADGILLPSACGGRGTCGQCVVAVTEGLVPPVPVEMSLLTRRQLADGRRLACQLVVRGDLAISLPSEVLSLRAWRCVVRSTRNVATLMKEIVLYMPDGESLDFRAGSYVQVTCPPHRTTFRSFAIDEEYRDEWDRLDLWRYAASTAEPATRAYSIANCPAERGIVTLLVRIATPPAGAPAGVGAGVVSSYLFGLKAGDQVEVSGPYGTFCADQSEREMVFVGGGAGMAPLRSIIMDQLGRLGAKRKITFWYGARNLRELFYNEELDRLEIDHDNFRWFVALSEPRAEDEWRGETGFIHEVLYERYLKEHSDPAACEYYVCGPPMMMKATLHVLERLGVPRENVRFDDFGT